MSCACVQPDWKWPEGMDSLHTNPSAWQINENECSCNQMLKAPPSHQPRPVLPRKASKSCWKRETWQERAAELCQRLVTWICFGYMQHRSKQNHQKWKTKLTPIFRLPYCWSACGLFLNHLVTPLDMSAWLSMTMHDLSHWLTNAWGPSLPPAR